MAEYEATVRWVRRSQETYTDGKYSRGHEWCFDGGARVEASSSLHVVPPPYSVEANVDPEEAFVASLSSCHMLFFLSIAAKKQFVVDEYVDNAVGVLAKGADGTMFMTRVTLRPRVRFSGVNQPTLEQLDAMHRRSHEQCFIANSVKTEVITEVIAWSEASEG